MPLPYDEEPGETSGNYPPIIRNADPPMGFSAFVLEIPMDSPPVWTIEVEDRNPGDTLFVRVLRDYDPEDPLAGVPPVFDDPFEPTEEVIRTLQLRTNTWCVSGVEAEYVFDVVVADGPFDDSRPWHNVVSGADSSTRSWRASCVETSSGT